MVSLPTSGGEKRRESARKKIKEKRSFGKWSGSGSGVAELNLDLPEDRVVSLAAKMSSAAVENGRPSSAARAMVVRAWRERWSDVQWGVRLKTVLHNGASTKASSSSSFPGDAANLSSVLLESALVGPAPNALVLGYLRHSLASRVVSRAALLRAVAAVDDRWDRPHCSSALVDLAAAAADRCEGSLRPSRGEDPVALSTALLHLLWWLLRLAAASLEAMEKSRRASAIGGSSPAEGTIDRANYKRSLDLARALVGGDLTQALLYVGKAEEKDTWSKVASACKMLGEQVKQSEFPSSSSFVKAEVSKLIASIKSLDPGRSSSNTSSSDAPMTGPPFSLSLILQPVVAFDAILHSSTSDQTSLGLRLYSSALTLNLSFSDLVFYLIRCSLFTVSQDTSIHSLKMDAFILVKLPGLLDQLVRKLPVFILCVETTKAFMSGKLILSGFFDESRLWQRPQNSYGNVQGPGQNPARRVAAGRCRPELRLQHRGLPPPSGWPLQPRPHD